jgi:uncharacterized membrane protein YbaN (DUF454 family)
MTLSCLCAIHCAALPFLALALPALARHSETAEAWVIGGSVLIGLSAVNASRRRRGSRGVRIAICAALFGIVASRALAHGPWETIVMIASSLTLIGAHFVNCRECRRACCKTALGAMVIVVALGVMPPAASAATPQPVAAIALRYLGTPYRFGGESLRGIDCGAFVQQVFRAFGVSLPRTAAGQYEMGCDVAREELRPGDLLFFRDTYRRGISHVGIFIGQSRFIHAARGGVRITSLASGYWAKRLAAARRVADVEEIAAVGCLEEPPE